MTGKEADMDIVGMTNIKVESFTKDGERVEYKTLQVVDSKTGELVGEFKPDAVLVPTGVPIEATLVLARSGAKLRIQKLG